MPQTIFQNLNGDAALAQYALLFGASGIVSLVVALTAWLHRRARGALSLIGLMLANALWAFCNVVMLNAPPPFKATAFVVADAAYFALVPCMFLFVLEYCGYGGRLTKWHMLLIWAIPFLSMALTLSNTWHSWMYTRVNLPADAAQPLTFQVGPGFAFYAGYSYTLVGICIFLLADTLTGTHAIYRKQLLWVMAALLFPFIADIFTVFGARLPTGMDIMPIALAASGIVLAIAITRRTLLDLVPVAQAVILETMREGVLVIDAQQRIVEINRAARAVLPISDAAIGQPLARYAPNIAAACAQNEWHAEIALDAPPTRFVELNASQLRDARGLESGRILVLHDVTENRHLRNALADMNANLQNQVAARTRELEETIAQLHLEIQERERVEASLRALEEMQARRVTDQSQKLAALYDVILFGGQALAIAQLQGQALKLVMNVMRADAGCVLTYDADANVLELAAAFELDDAAQSQLKQLPTDWLLQDRVPRTILHFDAATEMPDALRVRDMDASLSAPVYLRETPMGALLVFWRATPQLAVQDIALFSAMADQLAILIENARLRERAQASAVLQERRRLARDLHDSVTQSLHSLVLAADVALNRLHQGKYARLQESLEHLAMGARQALSEMRLMLYELRLEEPAQLNLVDALRVRLDAVERRAGIETELHADAVDPLPREWHTNVYAIAMEALNNSLKHAHASRVSVRVNKLARGIALDIADNGRGMNGSAGSGGIGLSSMRERAERIGGTLTISSREGQGTRVHLDVERAE